MTATIQVRSGSTATLLVEAGDGPSLVFNNDPTNTLFVGDTDAIRATDSTDVIPIAPGGNVSVTGQQNLYGITAPGIVITVFVLAGGTSFFQPPNLAGIGGASVFNQPTAPPTTAPNNSLWFKTDGSLWQLQAGVWTQVEFNANSVIEAGTIVAGLIAAGQIVAGIVNGTEIDGSIIRVTNGFGATIMSINKSAGSWIQYQDTGSATQGIPAASSSPTALTDEFFNSLLAGTVTYASISGTIFAVQNLQGNINFNSAPNFGGSWNIYSSLEPNTVAGFIGYFDNIGNEYNVGHREGSANNNQQITTTGNTDVTNGIITGLSATSWHLMWDVFYTGDQAAGAPKFNLALRNGAVLSFSVVEFIFYNSGGLNERLNLTTATFNTSQSGPTLVVAEAHMTVEAWLTLSSPGDITLAAAVGTAGDTFHVNTVFMRAEKRN